MNFPKGKIQENKNWRIASFLFCGRKAFYGKENFFLDFYGKTWLKKVYNSFEVKSLYRLYFLLSRKDFLILLTVINILGTVYGYFWYGSQLSETPAHFVIFVPDSPTASLFFVIVLIGFLLKKNFRLFEALALVTLVKYGLWAVVMNLLTLMVDGTLHWTGYMLIASHFAMAVEGILYSRYYNFQWKHLIIVAIWTLHNDIIDYVFFMYPRYGALSDFVPQIGYFTFWLSIACLFLAYFLVIKRKKRFVPHFH